MALSISYTSFVSFPSTPLLSSVTIYHSPSFHYITGLKIQYFHPTLFNLFSWLQILGLDLPRSVVYGFASILAPAGFNRYQGQMLSP